MPPTPDDDDAPTPNRSPDLDDDADDDTISVGDLTSAIVEGVREVLFDSATDGDTDDGPKPESLELRTEGGAPAPDQRPTPDATSPGLTADDVAKIVRQTLDGDEHDRSHQSLAAAVGLAPKPDRRGIAAFLFGKTRS